MKGSSFASSTFKVAGKSKFPQNCLGISKFAKISFVEIFQMGEPFFGSSTLLAMPWYINICQICPWFYEKVQFPFALLWIITLALLTSSSNFRIDVDQTPLPLGARLKALPSRYLQCQQPLPDRKGLVCNLFLDSNCRPFNRKRGARLTASTLSINCKPSAP